MVLLVALLVGQARAEETWQALFVKEGVRYERRSVSGSKFFEHRATFTVPYPKEAVIATIWMLWDHGTIDHAGSRDYLRRTDEEIVVHDRIQTPVVHDREVTLRLVKLVDARGPVGLRFEARNDLGPPTAAGNVLLPIVRGEWITEPVAGGTELRFTCYSEPGGSVPAFMVRRALQNQVVRDVERVRGLLR
jgi:hypothetical protein